MTAGLTIRSATLADLETIVSHRLRMFEDMETGTAEARLAALLPFREWLRERLTNGRYIGWLAQDSDGRVAAGAGVWLLDWPSGPLDSAPWRAYVLNVFVDPLWRRQGVAEQLLETILDWCRAQNIRTIDLHASDKGRPLYTRLGFVGTNEMRLILPKD